MKTEPSCCCLFPGDLSIYSLKCISCHQSITSPGSIGETLYHPIAMLHQWDMIVTEDTPGEFDNASIPLVCTSSDSYHQALALFNKTLQGSYENKDNSMHFVVIPNACLNTRVLFVRLSRST